MTTPATPQPQWKIICEAQGRNVNDPSTEKNMGGLVVYLTKDGYSKQEVNRIAFDRKNSANPRITFKAQTDKVIETAVHACKLLNEDLMGDGTTLV